MPAEEIKDIRQKIAHRHEQHDIQIDLYDIFDLFNFYMRHGALKAIDEDVPDEAQDAEIDLHRIGEIFI